MQNNNTKKNWKNGKQTN